MFAYCKRNVGFIQPLNYILFFKIGSAKKPPIPVGTTRFLAKLYEAALVLNPEDRKTMHSIRAEVTIRRYINFSSFCTPKREYDCFGLILIEAPKEYHT